MKSLKIVAILLFLGIVSCKEATKSENVASVSTVAFKESLEKNPGVILDVRPKKMYPEGHIKDAISLDYGDDNFKSELEKLDKNTPVYVYCNAGHRSRKTANMLGEMGFKKVVELEKGLDDWKAKNFPIKAGDSQTELLQEVILLASAKKFKEKTNGKQVQLIDVRTPEEYKEGHIVNAKNINFKEGDFLSKMNALNKDEPVYIYCRSGGRSGRVAKQLKEQGFKSVVDLDGGIISWKSNGFEVEN